jgi:hypothetical protein
MPPLDANVSADLQKLNVSADLQKLFELPACVDIKLPPPEKLEITLPTGGSLQAIADISKGIPNDCSLIVSLMLQIAPFLASIECLFKLLGVIGPLIDVIKGLGPPPDPFKLGSAIPKFLKAAEKLLPCLLVVTGAPVIPFLRDLLCLILKVLHCLIGEIKSIVDIMHGLTLRINVAKASGNIELQQALECAQENALLSAQHVGNSLGPVSTILKLVEPLLELVGLPAIQLPALGSQTDIQALQRTLQTLQDIEKILQEVVNNPLIGGCPA